MPEIENGPEVEVPQPIKKRSHPRRPGEVWLKITRVMFRGPILRFAGHLALLSVIALGVWAARMGLDTLPAKAARQMEKSEGTPEPTATAIPVIGLDDLPPYVEGTINKGGISRNIDVQTVFPTRPRLEIISYVVQQGDTLFGIAEKL